jgi:hypothetical protein
MAKRRGKKPKHWKEILLCRHKGPKRLGSVRRAYFEYRKEHGIPIRCDIEKCQFHDPNSVYFQNGKPFWLDAEVPLIVDHIRANTRDNRPENLRLVCPNCAFQLPTHGGRNKNTRIQEDAWGYIWKVPGGKVDCVYFASGGLKVGGSASAKVDVVRVTQDR